MDTNKLKESENLMALLEYKDKEIKRMIVKMQQQRMTDVLRAKNTKSKKETRAKKPS